ncbi:MAG TPA: hypothetical protein VGO93_27025 [Candidatus Xenobia bacterium]
MRSWMLGAWSALLLHSGPAILAQDVKPPAGPTIYHTGAPWDGAASELVVPLKATAGAATPVIRIDLWGDPTFAAPHVVELVTGNEGSQGPGRASYQTQYNRSMPVPLYGTVTLTRLVATEPAVGSYQLKSVDGVPYKGSFRAVWGNSSAGMIR